MARSSFGKRQREQTKNEKAAVKRARRQGGREPAADADSPPERPEPVVDEVATADLLEKIAEVHADFDAGRISYDEFEAAKADLLGRLSVD